MDADDGSGAAAAAAPSGSGGAFGGSSGSGSARGGLGATWYGSTGSKSSRVDRIVRLHRLHFVDKKGQKALNEVLERDLGESQRALSARTREHGQHIKTLASTMDAKIKNAVQHGSMSIWTQADRDRIEEKRQDPEEARQRMTAHMKEVAKSYAEQKTAMMERVRGLPQLSVRQPDELERIEERRKARHEAIGSARGGERPTAAAAESSAARDAGGEKRALSERGRERPQMSFWSEEAKVRIQECRHNIEEASSAAAAKIQERARQDNEQRQAMAARVRNEPSLNLRAPDERVALESRRQELAEAQERRRARMREVEKAWDEEKAAMCERVKSNPPRTFRSRTERDKIEQARQDPEEAHTKAKADMRDLARSYKQEKAAMQGRVSSIPPRTFRPKQEIALVEERRQNRASKL
eukprot:TRINITY_DN7207_c1_g1_i1.p1 TRINITY_DN7207_c1_g1~~TRINITY_DN7207_c1_g1_i1.p1  ORF type:complete len:431 (+),score=120.69 TRINITY_DN7207_c1_g1_i1:60-1295(+)